MIPNDINGRLPEGIHEASWTDVVDRFAVNARREALLSGLREALLHLRDAGCERAYLGGSFVTTKPAPKDIDVAWDVEGVDPDAVHPMFLDPYLGRQMTLTMFGCEFFPTHIVEGRTGLTFLEFFQTARNGEKVGIVAIDLETL